MNNNSQYNRTMYSKSVLSIFIIFLIVIVFNCAWADSGNSISTYFDTVQKIFIGYYQRPADPEGLLYWAARLDATAGNLSEIIEAFANSAESQALYGTINSSNISNVVNSIYSTLFGRSAEAAGLSYYVNGFNSGQFTAATIMLNVLYGAQNEDLLSVNNKVTAANLFTRAIDPDLDGRDFQYNYSGDADAQRAREFLLTVTWDPSTIPTEDEIRAFLVPEASATVGPAGGTVEVTNPSSPLYGVKVEIPAGALDQETTITIWTFSKSDLEREIGVLETEMRFFGGIKIDSNGAILNKSVTISIPNSFSATSADQLLVGQVIDLDSKSPSENIYKGVAYVGSPITFNISNFGSFGLLSPTTPLGLISGTFINQSGSPVPNGVIASSFSKPFVAQTNNAGYFEIPAGPAGSYTAVMGIPPSELVPAPTSPMGSMGVKGAQLPPTLPTPPASLTDVVVKIITDEFDLPEPPSPPCNCDPPPPSPVITSKEDPTPPFELFKEQTIQTYMFGLAGIYGGSAPPLYTFPLEAISYLWSGSMSVSTKVRFWTDNPSIATVDPQTGRLTAKSEGETWERGEVWITQIKNCGYVVIPCSYYLSAVPAKVIVECANIAGNWSGSENAIVTCTYDGETVTEPVSGSLSINIKQDGCKVNWTTNSYDRTGMVQGNNIQVSGLFMPIESGFNFSYNSYTVEGTISEDETIINMNGTGFATGTFCDEYGCFNFSCTTISDTVRFVR